MAAHAPRPYRDTWYRVAVAAAVGVSLALIASLHALRTDLSPVGDRLSLYALGPHGWLMAVVFVTMATALLALARRTWAALPADPLIRTTSLLLSCAAVGTGLSGVFRVQVSGVSDLWHSWVSAVAVVAVVVAALTWSLYRPWRRVGRLTWGGDAWAAVIAAVLTAISPLIHHSQWTGLGQRMLWLAVAVWMLLVNRRLPNPQASGRPG